MDKIKQSALIQLIKADMVEGEAILTKRHLLYYRYLIFNEVIAYVSPL